MSILRISGDSGTLYLSKISKIVSGVAKPLCLEIFELGRFEQRCPNKTGSASIHKPEKNPLFKKGYTGPGPYAARCQ